MKSILINIGSRSKKYSAYDGENQIFHQDFLGNPKDTFGIFLKESKIDIADCAVGVRIVAPGRRFIDHARIDDDFVDDLRAAAQIAPLHIESTLEEIEHIRTTYPSVSIYAISDSAFHKSIPDVLRDYALPDSIRTKYGIEKQGYHGLSLSSVVNSLLNTHGSIPEKIVVAHLGGGSSVTALRDRLSLDTSMGFTPLDGIPMAERIGSIDPGALLYIGKMEHKNFADLLEFISHSCGLEAVSGVANGDMKDLLDIAEDETHPNHHGALRAIDLYTANVVKFIGAMVAVLGGIDMLVFTGTIGEKSAPIREKICSRLQFIDAILDSEANRELSNPSEPIFIDADSKVKIVVVPTNEAKEMQTALLQSAL